MSPALELRPWMPEHDDALISWIPDRAALRAWGGETPRWPLTAVQLRLRRETPAVHGFTGLDETGEPVAHGELVDEHGGAARVARILIAPSARRHGYGRTLVRALIAIAAERGRSPLSLRVYAANSGARALYLALGFVERGGADMHGMIAMEHRSGASAPQASDVG